MRIFVITSGEWEERVWGATTSFSEAVEIAERVEREEIANFVRVESWTGETYHESTAIPESE